jgi:DNA polymerase-3 subunit alpha
LIAPGKLTDFCPLYCAEGSDSTVSQFDKDDVEAVGLVKFDFLGLRTLTIIDWAVRYVRGLRTEGQGLSSQTRDTQSSVLSPQSFSIESIPLDDKPTYDLLKASNTTAVFQLESRGMKDLIRRLQPDNFEEIIALVALYRPGPLESGMVEDFINRKHGRAKADYFHPELEASLKPTYGVIVYQEQVMQIAQIIGGYTLGGADMLRRAMGKKKAEEMAEQRDIFVGGAIKRDIEPKLATLLFDLMEKFAGYGFNKSHSAAYALVSYQTAYLKAHYPAAFMAATMSSDMDNTDKVHTFYTDTLGQGVKVLPPDINSSVYRFTPTDEKTIAYGLGAVKGTGEAAVENIVLARQGGPFKDLFDFCHRVDKRIVNRRAIEALIRAGAFDSIHDHRYQLIASLDVALGSAEQKARAANQNSLFGDDESQAMPVQMADVPRWKMREQLQQEKTALGFYLSGHPYQEFELELSNFVKAKLADITPNMVQPPSGNSGGYGNGGGRRNNAMPLVLAGVVSGVRILQTRRGKMAVVTLDDGSAQLEMTVFNDIYEANRPWLRDDELLVVRGKANLDEYTGNMRVTAEELFDFASARAVFAKRLDIFCSIDDKLRVPQLADLLKPYCGGQCPVQINYHNLIGSAPLRLGDAWQVTLPEELLENLRALCGARNVQVVYT